MDAKFCATGSLVLIGNHADQRPGDLLAEGAALLGGVGILICLAEERRG